MSYELDSEKKAPCACGKGFITLTSYSNDWGQSRESVSIECDCCKKTHRIESKYFCPKPQHDYHIYYLVEINNPENRIKLDL